MSRAKYLVKRSLRTFLLLWVILTFLFFFFRLMPGDYTQLMLNQGANPEAVARLEERWGLNDPLHIQYFRYLVNFVQLDVGTSLQNRLPVWEYVKPRMFNTLILALPGLTASYILGGVIGSFIGDKRGSRIEQATVTFFTLLGSFPGFFTAILAIIILSVWIPIFPTGGLFSTETTLQYETWWRPYLTTDFLYYYTLPFLVVSIRYMYGPTLIMRTSYVEVTGQDFAYFQSVSGLPYLRRIRHLGRHAILPLLTLYPISIVQAVSGLVLIELVFNWPGLGLTIVEAIRARDFPVIQFVFFVVAAIVVMANFAVDIVYGVIDPRISVGED
jgi:peptide/nickel transport system permease protein